MPNYDYVCAKCGTAATRNVPVAQRDAQVCDDCTYMLVRLPAAPGIAFKGPGFYVTDYGRKGG